MLVLSIEQCVDRTVLPERWEANSVNPVNMSAWLFREFPVYQTKQSPAFLHWAQCEETMLARLVQQNAQVKSFKKKKKKKKWEEEEEVRGKGQSKHSRENSLNFQLIRVCKG